MEKLTSFGYFAKPISLKFGSYEIKPLHNFDEIISDVKQSCFIEQNFIYPPIHEEVRKKHGIFCEKIQLPISFEKRDTIKASNISPLFAPDMFRFCNTHNLFGGKSSNYEINDLENSEVFFILQFVSYLYGVRIMPENLWYDGKLPIKSKNHTFFQKKTAEEALEFALANWKKMTKKKRAKIIGMLLMHSKIPSYHWAFEKLIWEYGLFECCYDWLFPEENNKKNKFRDIKKILDRFEIAYDKKDEEWANRIRETRNSLVHEQKWYHEMLQGKIDIPHYEDTRSLHRLNHRLLGLCLGFSGSYFKSNWSSIGQMDFGFDIE